MSVTRIADTDDDGTNLTGTPHNNAWKQSDIYDVMDARWSRFSQPATGTQTALSYAEADVVLLTNASDVTYRSIPAPSSPAKPGKALILISTGAGNVYLNHQDTTGTTAANRLINIATSGATPLAAGNGIAIYRYDDSASRWRLVSHQQGAFIAVASPTLAGSGSMTVASPVTTHYRYKVEGKSLKVDLAISFTIGGTPSTTVLFTLPASLTLQGTDSRSGCIIFDNNVRVFGGYRAGITTSAQVNFFANASLGGINWTAGANEGIEGMFEFEIA